MLRTEGPGLTNLPASLIVSLSLYLPSNNPDQGTGKTSVTKKFSPDVTISHLQNS